MSTGGWELPDGSPCRFTLKSIFNQGCQMVIAGFLDRICLALRASGLWLRYAALQNLIPSFPWIAPPHPPPWRNPRKGRDQILPSGNLVGGLRGPFHPSLFDSLIDSFPLTKMILLPLNSLGLSTTTHFIIFTEETLQGVSRVTGGPLFTFTHVDTC